jgi:hypothetical protein
MTNSLKDFIRQVRDCRTTAEERAIVAKECAMIRTSLKVIKLFPMVFEMSVFFFLVGFKGIYFFFFCWL